MKRKAPRPPRHFSHSGFTLLELMTAIAVLAVLLGIGVPSFTNIIRNNQIATKSNDLVVALTLARSEAVKRGVRVSVCPAEDADQDSCGADGSTWINGWIVFEDDVGGAGTIDVGDDILQVWPALSNGVAVTTAATSVTFSRTGRAEFARSFEVWKTGCSTDQQRAIDVDISGRVSLGRENCPTS